VLGRLYGAWGAGLNGSDGTRTIGSGLGVLLPGSIMGVTAYPDSLKPLCFSTLGLLKRLNRLDFAFNRREPRPVRFEVGVSLPLSFGGSLIAGKGLSLNVV